MTSKHTEMLLSLLTSVAWSYIQSGWDFLYHLLTVCGRTKKITAVFRSLINNSPSGSYMLH